jgi:hypothetical protein
MEQEIALVLRQKLYSFVALFIAFILLFLSIFIANQKSEKEIKLDPIDKYFAQQKVLIESQTQLLEKRIDSLNFKLQQNDLKLDKIYKSKSQIQYVYIQENKIIDGLSNDAIIQKFNAFFSKSISNK